MFKPTFIERLLLNKTMPIYLFGFGATFTLLMSHDSLKGLDFETYLTNMTTVVILLFVIGFNMLKDNQGDNFREENLKFLYKVIREQQEILEKLMADRNDT